jgi:hypothetical protein
MFQKIVSIQEDGARSATADAVDALDRELDLMWGLIAVIEIILREKDDQYVRSALALAHRHLDGLSEMRRTLGAP